MKQFVTILHKAYSQELTHTVDDAVISEGCLNLVWQAPDGSVASIKCYPLAELYEVNIEVLSEENAADDDE